MRYFLLLTAVVLGLAVPAFHAEEKKADEKPGIDKLIEQLTDKDFEARQKAAEAIEKLGPACLPALQKNVNHPDADARGVIRALIAKFEEMDRTAPKRITIDMKDKPIKDIVEELSKQSGYKLDIGGNLDDKKTYRLQCKDTPFWEALDELCVQEGIIPQIHWTNASTIHLYFQNRDQPHVYRNGAFRMVAQSFHLSRTNRLDAKPRDPKAVAPDLRGRDTLQFTFTVMAEPRLRMMSVGAPQIVEAEDDQGQSLVPQNVPAIGGRVGRFREAGQQSVSLELAPAGAKATTVKKLKGTLPVYLVKESKTVTVTDKLEESKGKKFDFDKHTIEVEEFRKCDDGSFQLKITFDAGGNDNELNVELLDLVDDKNVKFGRGGYGMSGRNRKYSAEVSFQQPFNGVAGAPAKLTYTILKPSEHVIPFEFKDLPLP